MHFAVRLIFLETKKYSVTTKVTSKLILVGKNVMLVVGVDERISKRLLIQLLQKYHKSCYAYSINHLLRDD